jgi:translation initiation factor IF-3
MAEEVGLDLVEIAPDAQPPVCKVMDFGKYKYEIAQKARLARKNQTHVVVKEMKMRPKIDTHDYETKKAHIERFLLGGDKVKVTMMFRGREQARPDTGFRVLQKLSEDSHSRVCTKTRRQKYGYGPSADKAQGWKLVNDKRSSDQRIIR